MSTDKFQLFLEQSRFASPVLNEAKLNEVLVDASNLCLVFDITLAETVEVDTITPFLQTLKSYFIRPKKINQIEVNLHYQKLDNFKQFALAYWDYALYLITKQKPRYMTLKNYKVQYEDQTYTILIDKDSTFIKEYFPIVQEALRSFGFEVKITYQVEESLTPMSKRIEKTIAEQSKMLEEQAKMIQQSARQQQGKQRQIFTKKASAEAVSIKEIPIDSYRLDKYKNEKGDNYFLVEGTISNLDIRILREKYTLLTFVIGDEHDAIYVKRFLSSQKDKDLAYQLKDGDLVQVEGRAEFDSYQKDVVIQAQAVSFIEKTKKQERLDKAKEKRIEFHLHTKMSNMDAVTDVEDYIEQAIKWGHEAIAFTDHNGLYAFPDIYKKTKNKPIKPIYGVELNFVNEQKFKITSTSTNDILLKDASYVVFDLETTGLSNTRDKIIEIAALKIEGGMVTDKFQHFVNPGELLSAFTTEFTGITDEDLMQAPLIDEILPAFLEFANGHILIAHNALFDVGHIQENAKRLNLSFDDSLVIDTLSLARYFYSNELKRFNLKAVAKHFKVDLERHHRAEKDTKATSDIWLAMQRDLQSKGIKTYKQINEAIDVKEAFRHIFPSHINILAQNQKGYQNMFRLVSDALTDHYHNGPRATLAMIGKYREGILIGSGCYKGEVFETALNRSDEELKDVIAFYDYIEVQPPLGYRQLFSNLGEDAQVIIEAIISKIVRYAKEAGKIIIATGDVHYLNASDAKYREIYIRTNAVGGGIHDLKKYDQMPDQHFMTTDEMLRAFNFLGKELAEEIVIKNTHALNAQIEVIEAFPKQLYSLPNDAFRDLLGVESISDEVKRLVYDKLGQTYGQMPPDIVSERVSRELNNIISNEFAPIYYISHLLVKKSLEEGYLVGSRGSVGSSLVATLLDITEVNPLRPHYRCPNADFTAFYLTDEEIHRYGITPEQKEFQKYLKNVQSGYDLPNQTCPHCQAKLIKDGHDIPFETFLGFDGDKVPDIDLNFSGDYQAKAHAYVRELLGSDHTFRAGTIQTVAERNAYGYVKGYLEENRIEARSAQIERLAKRIEGVRRSTGQHPGGIVVVPKHKTIFDVTPIQYPADDITSDWKTTHFDYHSFENNLLKLDILGHDDPTMIKYLMDYVHEHPAEFPFQNAQDIPLDDPEVYRLFSGTEVIGVESYEINSEVASYAIPEFGTSFTRQMLVDTKPKTFAGLVKISGLSHGTDVWLQNAQSLINGHPIHGKVPFGEIIGCRDDIMVQLSNLGMEPLLAFEIMEFVRKGKPSKDKAKWLEYEQIMRNHQVPEWYIWSASRIKYMFPKAHATAYVIMAMRIAWFKIYKPLLFYSGFFSKRAVQFDYEIMVAGANAIRNKLTELGETKNLKVKDENLLVTLSVALEMTKRGFAFLPVDIHKSGATTFVMEENGLRMPFVSIDGLGAQVAEDIVERRKERLFTSKGDISERTKINKTVFDKMEKYGVFKDLTVENNVIESGLFAL